jgi:hypothetical protein
MRISLTKTEHADLQKTSEELRAALADPDLAPERRARLEQHLSEVTGALTSPLLPSGVGRKLMMLAAVVVALAGPALGEPWLLLLLVLAATFSPRIVGEALYFVGALQRDRKR